MQQSAACARAAERVELGDMKIMLVLAGVLVAGCTDDGVNSDADARPCSDFKQQGFRFAAPYSTCEVDLRGLPWFGKGAVDPEIPGWVAPPLMVGAYSLDPACPGCEESLGNPKLVRGDLWRVTNMTWIGDTLPGAAVYLQPEDPKAETLDCLWIRGTQFEAQ